MSDMIRRFQEVKSVVEDSSRPKTERLRQALKMLSESDSKLFDDGFIKTWEAHLSETEEAVTSSNKLLERGAVSIDPKLREECEQLAATEDAQFQQLLDTIDSAASRFIEAEIERLVAELHGGVRMLPEDAIRQIREHRELMVPRLIHVLRDAAAAARKGKVPQGNDHLFALYLLTEFEAHEAFPAILEAFSLPGELPYDLFGDVTTSDFQRILAIFAGDNPETIDRLIDDQALYEYVRWSAAETYVRLVRDGRIERVEAARRLQQHLRQAIDHHDEVIATGLVCELSDFASQEALDDIRDAFARGLVDESLIDLAYVEKCIAEGEARLQKACEQCGPTAVVNTIEELREWWCFQEEHEEPPAPRHIPLLDTPYFPVPSYEDTPEEPAEPPVGTIVSHEPRVGRNVPCPCGSGKKFKKCCGARG